MRIVDPIKNQKLSLSQNYKLYLSKRPRAKDKLSSKYNLFDDLNSRDKAMMKEAINYLNLKGDR